jgi:hypothetical protein
MSCMNWKGSLTGEGVGALPPALGAPVDVMLGEKEIDRFLA